VPQRALIQIPDGVGHARAVVIDDGEVGHQMARQMDLADMMRIDRVDLRCRIDSVIEFVYVKVVDVEQDAAAAARRQLVEKAGLVVIVAGEAHITRYVLDQDRPPQRILQGRHARDQQIERGRS